MLRICKCFSFYIYIFIGFNFFGNVVCDQCQFQDKNFETLSFNSPWLIWNNSNGYLELSLCKPLSTSSCGGNVSVCYYDVLQDKYSNFGNNGSEILNIESVSGVSLRFEGDRCSTSESLSTTIHLMCGKNLGYPKFVPSSNPCKLILEWHTTALCTQGTKLSQIKSTKCYGYNSKHLFTNLNTLDDEYEVDTGYDNDDYHDDDDDSDIFTNFKDGVIKVAVCRDMESDESCAGKGACLVLKNETKLSLGRISTPILMMADDTLSLVYRDDESNIPGCKEVTTSFHFYCPQRGIGSKPLIFTSSRCFYNITWQTEAACPVQTTSVNSSCSLASNKHVVDLNSLSTDKPHRVTTKDDSGATVEYQLHVCSVKLIECGGHMTSACQVNLDNNNTKSIGNFLQQTLRYSDGTLKMAMEGGEPCGTGFFRNTIINFHCDRTTSNGSISFAYEDMCTYVFNWNTSLACLTHPLSCSFKHGNLTYDLSSLIKIDSEENWRTPKNSTILNVCRGLNMGDPLSKNCSPGAICRRVGDRYINHGTRMEALTIDRSRGAIRLEYVEGDVCGTNNFSSASLLIFCDPNVINSQPYLVGNSVDDGCHINLEWYSSSACGVGHIIGNDCRIKDPMTGLQFDLSPLKSTGSDGKGLYKVVNDYDYFISICGPLVGSPCNQPGVGACQVSKKGQVHSMGQWSDKLHYVNGLLRLTYKNGDNYNSEPPVSRHTDIEFVCNSRAGLGEPLFVVETNRTYKFLWHTHLACPNNFDKCSSFVNDGHAYDLLFLVQQGSRKNWQMETSLNGKQNLVFNLCRGLLVGPEIKTCNPIHSACLTFSDNNETISLGRSLNQPEVRSGTVVINYEQGSQCKEDSALNYSVEVHLHCTKMNEQSNPSSVNISTPCKFKVDWYTSASCPIIDHKIDDKSCVLNLDRSGQTFNITRFRGQTFYLNVASVSYKISLCGESAKCGAGIAACTVDGEKVSTEGRKLSINADGSPHLQLVSDKMKILIRFKCNPFTSPANESLEFIEARSDWLLFSFSTHSACFGTTVNCQTFDEAGNKYDLEPLSKVTGSWIALNSNGDSCEFNLCRSLPSGSTKEPCVSSGSCLKRSKDNELMNGGQVKDTLEAASKGFLRVKYSGGGRCRLPGTKRSTLILLKCSAVAHDPVLLTDMDNCEAVIDWATPFACPIEHAVGKNCQVRHPSYTNQMFDLSPLKTSRDFEVDFFDVGKYLIRVCSKVQDDDSCKNLNAGACLVSHGSRFNMGTSSDELEYKGGMLSLYYRASLGIEKPRGYEVCPNVSTSIYFKCEHDNLGISSGPIYRHGSCHREFEWVTSLACFKYSKVSCKIDVGDSITIDLSHLMLHDSNYEVYDDDEKFIINICSTLVHTEGNSCPPNSTACLIDTKSGTSTSIGTIPDEDETTFLSMEGEKLKLVYRAKSESRNFTTVIYFSCDSQAPETSTPSYVLTEGGNTFIFTWSTRLMCRNNQQVNNCSVTDPVSGHQYDLSSLRIGNPYQVEAFGQKFEVLVCSCDPIGSCPSHHQLPWLLTYNHGVIFLKYRGGRVNKHDCDKNQQTVIGFECPGDGEEEGLRFVMKNDDCLYVFQWKTKLACRNELKCLVQGSSHTLSPLVKHDKGYHADMSVDVASEVEKASINVCSRILGEEGCRADAAVCLRMRGGDVLSGGTLSEEPKYDANTTEISLTYRNGDPCQTGTWSTKILFVCSQIPDLPPMLISVDKSLCLFTFRFKTGHVCLLSPQTFNDCKFKLGDVNHDLTGLSHLLATQKIATKGGYFIINLCSKSVESVICASSAVCLHDKSTDDEVEGYGDKNNLNIVKEGSNVKFHFSGTVCKRDELKSDQATLIFVCDHQNPTPVTEILFESDCSIIIIIKANVICPPTNKENTTPNRPRFPAEEAVVHRDLYTPIVITVVVVMCLLFVVFGLLVHRKKRSQRGYEPVKAMRYSRDHDEELHAPLFTQEANDTAGLQNYTSDDDLML